MFKGSIASQDMGEVVRALKGAAEPTRLRLLWLLSHGELTVGEICSVLGQSQPRISHHLRLLTEAGLLDRFREQQCVYYRTPAQGRALEWLRQLLALLDPDTPQVRADRERATGVIAARALAAAAQLDAQAGLSEANPASIDLAAVLLEELGPAGCGELLDVGTGAGRMLQLLGPRARHAVGIDISPPALRLARTRVHAAGLAHCELRHGDMYQLPYAKDSFDTVTFDRVLAGADRPQVAIAEAARTLRPQGRLLVIEDFDDMDARVGGNPLSQLRRWIDEGGLATDRLRPFDLPEGHCIVALARHREGLQP
jgi:ArsR family transcriptional regulator